MRHINRLFLRRGSRRGVQDSRAGLILVKAAILMPVLLGMMGLVVDVGLLLATYRQVHNAADAAALAAAMDRVRGKSDDEARQTALEFIRAHNGLSEAPELVAGQTFNVPPAAGPFAEDENFVEVIVAYPVQTLFIHVLGVEPERFVRARAVAGYRPVAAGEGVMVLDRTVAPGLRTSNNATIRVDGRIVVNSEGGGVDEEGNPVSSSLNQVAASAGKLGIFGTEIRVVGGVNDPANFRAYVEGDPDPLYCRSLPEPDPLINLPTPTVENGVDPTFRGSVSVTNNGVTGLSTDQAGQNKVAEEGEVFGNGLYENVAGHVILHPGIYQRIDISGGDVIFLPGIYVIKPGSTGMNDGLKVTGGTITAAGVMIYSTGHNYDPYTGLPDADDKEQLPPASANFGNISFTAGAYFTPIATSTYSYGSMYSGARQVSEKFDAMLFYQRRRNDTQVSITGDTTDGGLTGTLYAKWAQFRISGQGTFNAQFIVGSMDVTGQGNVTILGEGTARGKANKVFLVD